jgi:rhodanese-related sulfurtransferase
MFTQLTEFAANHEILSIAFVALLLLTFLNEMKLATRRYSSLTPAGAVQIMNNEEDNTLILDVREPSETASGKIAKAVQIPVSSIDKRIGELEKHRDKQIIVYCKSGTRSGIACKALNKAGFEHVHNLSGGIMAWQEAQLPLVKK